MARPPHQQKKQRKPKPKAEAPPLLRVSGLRRRFGEVDVLAGFDLDVRAGEAVALVGRNGAGKSTVLRCVTGADKPTGGTIELDGKPLDERSEQVRTHLAVVMDDMDFFPDLSVVEHLDLFAKAHRVADAQELVDEVLHEVGLIAQAGQLPGTLSSGQRRRLALASAFVRPRQLLVLDEPEQRLDRAGLDWLAGRLVQEKAQGLAVLMASHATALVEAVADRVVDVGAHREPAGREA
ncbi:ABC transporter ATP-binding protein [Nocardioides panaciterrulae]|uniref:Heme ABC exporter ATP-binding subunit CcmA n=1 Tax=Nocardioides panaciterrulae TaxID=661492 RepID=A0A7Y9JBS6_9ACTN|nr:heme ABC exporter ATP-binding subunit CcmA [Nocardioides panaciterrulae]